MSREIAICTSADNRRACGQLQIDEKIPFYRHVLSHATRMDGISRSLKRSSQSIPSMALRRPVLLLLAASADAWRGPLTGSSTAVTWHGAVPLRGSSTGVATRRLTPSACASSRAAQANAGALSFLPQPYQQPAKRLGWLVAGGGLLWVMRPFSGLLLSTFVISFVAQSFINNALRMLRSAPVAKVTRLGDSPNIRRSLVATFYIVLVSVIAMLVVGTVPRLIADSQYLLRVSESDDPCVSLPCAHEHAAAAPRRRHATATPPPRHLRATATRPPRDRHATAT